MMLVALVLGSLLLYSAIGAYVWGKCGGLDGRGERLDPSDKFYGLAYYHDEPCSWYPAFFWPFFGLYLFLWKPLARAGYRSGKRIHEAHQARIELEKRFRVELEQAQKELEAEEENERQVARRVSRV